MKTLFSAVTSIQMILKPHVPFFVLLFAFVITSVLTQITLPPMEGPDEPLHYSYVVGLRLSGQMPDRNTDQINSTRQESGQPPLTYSVMATFMNLLGIPEDSNNPPAEIDSVRNLWYTPLDPWHRTDNENVYYHDRTGNLIDYPQVGNSDRVARLISLAFCVVAVIGAYGVMRQVFKQVQWVLLSTALFAFMPIVFQISADVSNDAGTMAFTTLVIWQTLRQIRINDQGSTKSQTIGWLIIGLLLGLTGLSKVNGLLVGTGVITVLIIDWRIHGRSVWRVLLNGTLIAIPFVFLFGSWVLYGWLTFHSPLGLEGHSQLFSNPNQSIPSLGAFLLMLSEFALTYLGKIGVGGIRFQPTIYALLGLIPTVSVIGYALWIWSRPRINWRSLHSQQAITLIAIMLANIAGIIYWLVTLYAINENIQARLIYPAHSVFVILVVGGLYLLYQRLPKILGRLLRIYTVVLPIALSLLLVPVIQTDGYSATKVLTAEQLPQLQGQQFDFDHTIRFLGYKPHATIIRANTIETFTLCWKVLRIPNRQAAFALKLFDAKGTPYGDRTSVFGMGHFPADLWQIGDIFCDDVDILVKSTLPANQAFNMLVVLLDAHTLDVNWQVTRVSDSVPVKFPVVDQIRS